jgi:hypothetical protein
MTIRIKSAVAAVLASCAAGSAMALPVNATIEATVYISGATAQDTGIDFTLRKMCVDSANAATRMDIYRYNTNERAVTCMSNNTLIPNLGLGAGDHAIQIIKYSVGGSTSGVTPLAPAPVGAALTVRTVNSTTTCTGDTAVGTSGTFAQYHDHSGCSAGGTTTTRPNFGFSDVEPRKISGPAADAGVNGEGANHLIFGIPVNTKLYRALQANQGLTQDDSYANMPSLSKQAIAGAFNGSLVIWSQLTNKDGTSVAVTGDDTVKVCRRGTGSGTQAITEITFLRNRCNIVATAPFLAADNAGGGTGGGTAAPAFNLGNVYAGSGAGNVRDCLDSADTNNFNAIGLLSMECSPDNITNCGSTSPRAYRFVKVDGFAPTLVDTVSGNYDFYAEQSINTGPAGLVTAQGTAVRLQMKKLLSDVTVIGQLNTAFKETFGHSGLLAVPDANSGLLNSPPYTQASVDALPVNTSFKNPSGAGTDNCQISPVINSSFLTPDRRPILPQNF